MKNKLGHDNASEILTVIARMRQGMFEVLSGEVNKFEFKITLKHTILCNCVALDSYTVADYYIRRESVGDIYKYYFKQQNGLPERVLNLLDGFVIWGLIDEKLESK